MTAADNSVEQPHDAEEDDEDELAEPQAAAAAATPSAAPGRHAAAPDSDTTRRPQPDITHDSLNISISSPSRPTADSSLVLFRPPLAPPSSRRRASSHTGVARTRPRRSSSSYSTSSSSSTFSPPPGFRKGHYASNSFSHVNSFRPSLSSLGLGAGYFWTPLASILHSLPQSPPPEPVMFATNNTQSEPQAVTGDDLENIVTDHIGFLAIAGDSKIRFLPEPWPQDSLPKPTSSLLSIASRSELVAAAGPQKLIIASTTAVRAAFSNGGAPTGASAEHNFKPFTPELSLNTPNISQVAFSSDEASLVISAEESGGLAVYDVQALKQGSTQSAFELATNGLSVRALIPNPAPELAHRFAVVLSQGQLMLADLKERALSQGPNGVVLKDGVSCVSWSAKGKQLVAGLGDGTAVQMEPDGTVKANIPRYPGLTGDQHVSGITWLDNDHFLIIYTLSHFENTPESIFVYVSREPKTTKFMFQKLTEPIGPFGMNRSPPHHFICRLRNFPPSLSDALVVASTASNDVGLFTCSTTPLSPQSPNTADKYTSTVIGNDARTAQLPVYSAASGEMLETSPIGLALDLSSKETVKEAIPSEEMNSSASPMPLPNVMTLNHEGVLSSWWFVYSDSIKAGTPFPGLFAVSGETQQTPSKPQASSAFPTPSQPSTFDSASSMGAGAFGQRPSFGTPTAPTSTLGSTFGAPSPLGANNPLWSSAAGVGHASQTGMSGPVQPTFGSSTPIRAGSGFGVVGGLGNRASPWASQPQNQQASESKPPNPFSSMSSSSSPFASMATQSSSNANDKSPFGAFSNSTRASGFASLGQPNAKPLFGGAPTSAAPELSNQPSFGSTVTIGSNFSGSYGGPSTLGEPKSAWATPALSNNTSAGSGNKGVFGSASSPEAEMTSGDMDNDMETESQPQEESKEPADGAFGLFSSGTSGFKLGSSFKPDPEPDHQKDSKPAGPSLFGESFGKALGETQKSSTVSVPQSSGPALSLPSEQTDRQEDKGKSPTKPFVKPLNTGVYNINGDGKDQKNTSKLATSTLAKEEPKEAPLSSKANSDSSWETVQKSPDPTDLEPAPLPPSPPPSNPQQIDEPPLPPFPPSTAPAGKQVADPPLPPSFSGAPASKQAVDPPPPPSPSTVALGRERQTEGPAVPLPSSSITPARQQPAQGLFSMTPASTTPAAPPPRSPSPKKPHQFQDILSTTPTGPPPIKPTLASRSVSRPSSQRPSRFAASDELPTPAEAAPKAETESHDEYEDDSDIRIHQELVSSIEPSKHLAPFIAHQDYVGKVPGQGVSAQIERVYRDIQSMIDTLGLNARSLRAFVSGHEQFKDGGRLRDDLDQRLEDDWCLIEIADLGVVESEVSRSLDTQRLQDVGEMLADLQDMQRALAKLRTRHQGLQQLIRAYQNLDGGGESHGRNADDLRNPLTAEQSVVLVDLRKDFTEFQKLLAQAEDSLTLLRAKVATAQSSSDGDQFGASKKVPTFEAVANTINKMTRMVEQKSGDVDVLEAQMRKLRFKPSQTSFDASGSLDEVLGRLTLGSSTAGEKGRFRTPPSSRGRSFAQNNGISSGANSGTYQLSYDSGSDDDYADSMIRGSPTAAKKNKKPRPKVSPEEVEAYTVMAERREKVLRLFRRKVCERGTQVQGP